MTYTTQQLQAMSDLDLNVAITNKLGFLVIDTEGSSVCYFDGLCKTWFNFNNHNDIMPLAFERKISIEYCHYGKWWSASAWEQTGKNEDTMIANFGDKEKPLRAIACLILMMED